MLIPIIWIPGIALFGTQIVARFFQYPRRIALLSMVAVMTMTMGLTSLAL